MSKTEAFRTLKGKWPAILNALMLAEKHGINIGQQLLFEKQKALQHFRKHLNVPN